MVGAPRSVCPAFGVTVRVIDTSHASVSTQSFMGAAGMVSAYVVLTPDARTIFEIFAAPVVAAPVLMNVVSGAIGLKMVSLGNVVG